MQANITYNGIFNNQLVGKDKTMMAVVLRDVTVTDVTDGKDDKVRNVE